ncbi:MAG: hypothetical protein ACYCVN_11565 [Acidimicrobiales bacterium]
MSAGQIAVLVATALSIVVALVLLSVVVSLRRQTRLLAAIAGDLEGRTRPLIDDARRLADEASVEMERVGAVLDSTEAVHATVDSASRLAYRAFANPVVKVLAVRAGAATGLRRLARSEETMARHGTPVPDPGRGERSGKR